MGSATGFELENFGRIVEAPNADESQIEVLGESVDTEPQALIQNPASRQGSADFGCESLEPYPLRQLDFRASAFGDNRSQAQAGQP
jgi:hypothetical protein